VTAYVISPLSKTLRTEAKTMRLKASSNVLPQTYADCRYSQTSDRARPSTWVVYPNNNLYGSEPDER
jgi:hypothetical protein